MNATNIRIHVAEVAQAGLIAAMAVALTDEIMQRTGFKHFLVGLQDTTQLCAGLIASGAYTAFVAREGSELIGFAGLCESNALYAGGTFGIIQEFYVAPHARSSGVGAALLDAAFAHGRAKAWKRVELCTPPLPEFDRSLAFYERNGFEITGGRKMKCLL
ncbi:MAG: N-acetyltransferase family protein [Gammaproteobacteria bacterium]